MIAPYDESLYRKTKRKFYPEGHRRAGKPVKHSRWVKRSGVPRYSKPQEKDIGEQFVEPQGWHRGARVHA